jgi:hypothetical protein
MYQIFAEKILDFLFSFKLLAIYLFCHDFLTLMSVFYFVSFLSTYLSSLRYYSGYRQGMGPANSRALALVSLAPTYSGQQSFGPTYSGTQSFGPTYSGQQSFGSIHFEPF